MDFVKKYLKDNNIQYDAINGDPNFVAVPVRKIIIIFYWMIGLVCRVLIIHYCRRIDI